MIKILIAGDFVPRRRVAAQIESGDFSCLDEVKPIIQSADYSIVNFESPVVMHEAKPIDKTGPNLCCSEQAMQCVAQAGFTCVTLANNHFRDYGQVGVEDTLEACNKYMVDFVGGGKNLVEAQQILYKTIGDQRFAIINVCEHEWSIATEIDAGSNPLDVITVSRDIKKARNRVDYVLVIIHGGTEHYNLPTPRMKSMYRFFVEQGADVVINHHQHCYSGYEIYQGKPIFYGLGNFCFDNAMTKNQKLWEEGCMVELILSDTVDFRLHPYVQCGENNSSVVLMKDRGVFDKSIQQLNIIIEDDKQLRQSFDQWALKGVSVAKNILTPYSSAILKNLYVRKIIPSFVNKDRLKLLRAHIQCESHRDVLLYGLNYITKQE